MQNVPISRQYSPLHYTCALGNLQATEQLLRQMHPDTLDRKGYTPLMWAAAKGHLHIAQCLVDKYCANVNQQSLSDGETALSIAVREGHAELSRYLLANGADANLASLAGNYPLHVACALGRLDLVELLIGFGAWLEATDLEGETPLFYAVRENQTQVALTLLQRGADPRHENDDGETAADLVKEVASEDLLSVMMHYVTDVDMAEADADHAHAATRGAWAQSGHAGDALDASVSRVSMELEDGGHQLAESMRRSMMLNSSSSSIPFTSSSAAAVAGVASPSASPSSSFALAMAYHHAQQQQQHQSSSLAPSASSHRGGLKSSGGFIVPENELHFGPSSSAALFGGGHHGSSSNSKMISSGRAQLLASGSADANDVLLAGGAH